MNITNSRTLSMSPRIEESAWNPVKLVEKVKVDNDTDLQLDNELFDNSYFD